MSFESFTGTPILIQGNYAPTQSENINIQAWQQGILHFFWDRLNNKMLWLQNIDSNNLQTWIDYPQDIDSLCIISVLPILSNKLYWFVANYSPTSAELIPGNLFDGTYGMLWWNNTTMNLFKLTGFTANGDGTYTQSWTQII